MPHRPAGRRRFRPAIRIAEGAARPLNEPANCRRHAPPKNSPIVLGHPAPVKALVALKRPRLCRSSGPPPLLATSVFAVLNLEWRLPRNVVAWRLDREQLAAAR